MGFGWRTIVVFVATLCACSAFHTPREAVKVVSVWRLSPDEGVFAYARIAPDGRALAYAAETPRDGKRHPGVLMRVVDLKTGLELFSEAGIDPYWSPDGSRLIYKSRVGDKPSVSIWDRTSGKVARDVAPVALGDYYSWGRRDDSDVILTVKGYYVTLDSSRPQAVDSVPPCAGLGTGMRPLLSKDAQRVSVFADGRILVRDLAGCDSIIDTGMQGAKADFDWSGRYLAFHAAKSDGSGYDIWVVDLKERTARRVTDLPGASLFPSWTADGRLCFRHDANGDHRFLLASGVLSAATRALPPPRPDLAVGLHWREVLRPIHARERISLVLIWAPWSAHVPEALRDLKLAQERLVDAGMSFDAFAALDPSSQSASAEAFASRFDLRVPTAQLLAGALGRTSRLNQIPSNLLFVDDRLADVRLGAQSLADLEQWVRRFNRQSP